MEIAVADQRILLFDTQITPSDAKAKSWDKKISSFDTISKFGSFLSRPKDEDFELIYSEFRYDPFWHVVADAKYIYDRNSDYQVPVSASEVRSVTYADKEFEVSKGHIHLTVLEHCLQEESDEVFIDGINGRNKPEMKRYLSFSPKPVVKLEENVSKEAILVPPQTRISAIMRDSLAKMIKGIQADKILKEEVRVKCADLYYHPVYAYQYLWKSKMKEAIIEVDALTGEISTGNRTFKEYLGKVLDRNFLFDLGADAAGMLIPGGSIAVKIAKKYIDNRK